MTKTEGQENIRDCVADMDVLHPILKQTSTPIKKECAPSLEKGDVLPKCTTSQKETWTRACISTQLMRENVTENRNEQVLLHPWSTEVTPDWNTSQFLKKMLLSGSVQCLENVLWEKLESSMSFVYEKEITSLAFISHTATRKNKWIFRPLAQHCKNMDHRKPTWKTEKFCAEWKEPEGIRHRRWLRNTWTYKV